MDWLEQQNSLNKKLIALVGVILALLLVAICFVSFLLIRSKLTAPPAEPQVVPPQIPLPTAVVATEAVEVYVPAVVAVEAPQPVAAPTTVQTPTVWRFLSINKDDVGTFENVNDPSQRLKAACKDKNRPAPDRGVLYTLDDSGILRQQDGGKKYQRFEVLPQD